MMKKIAVLGAGSWGSILANLLDENGHSVRLWSYSPAQVTESLLIVPLIKKVWPALSSRAITLPFQAATLL